MKRAAAGERKTSPLRRDTAAAGTAQSRARGAELRRVPDRGRGSCRDSDCGRVDGRRDLRARGAPGQPQLSPRTLTVRFRLPVAQTTRRVMRAARAKARRSGGNGTFAVVGRRDPKIWVGDLDGRVKCGTKRLRWELSAASKGAREGERDQSHVSRRRNVGVGSVDGRADRRGAVR